MTPDEAAAEPLISEFASLLSEAIANSGDFRVLAATGQGELGQSVAPGCQIELFEDTATLFRGLTVSALPCIVIPPWGRIHRNDFDWHDVNLDVVRKPFGVVVPRTELSRSLPQQFGHLGVPSLVLEGRVELSTSGLHVALVIIDPARDDRSTITRFFRTPEADEGDTEGVISDFQQLLSQQGGVTKFGFVYRGVSLAGEDLRPEFHDPRIAARVADLADFGEGAVVADVFDVLRSTISRSDSPSNPAYSEREIRVIGARDVTLAGEILPIDEGVEDARPGGLVPVLLRAGDLVMRQIERLGRVALPVEIESGDLPLAAGRTLLVLRSKFPLEREELEFYKFFLGSQRARDAMRPSVLKDAIVLTGLQRAPLPRPDSDLLGALLEIRQGQESLRSWVSEGVGLTSAAFSGPAGEARRTLIETGRQLRQRVEAASQVGSLEHRIANFYPYPIAHKWRLARVAESAGDDAKTYMAILDCFEATMAFGAAIGLAFAHANSVQVPSMKEVRRKLGSGQRGTSLGDWVNILKTVSTGKAFKSLDPNVPLAAIRELLPEGSKFAKAQERLSKRRNDESHQRRVDPVDLPAAIDGARTDLEMILDNAAFLADLQFCQIESARWDSILGRGEVVARALRGDHPVAQSIILENDEPGIEIDSLYIKDVAGPFVLLRPFLIIETCPGCRTWSTFHPDRRENGDLLFKSVDHSHVIVGTKHEPALRAVGYLE